MNAAEAKAYYCDLAVQETGAKDTLNAVFGLRFVLATSGGQFRVSFNDVLSDYMDYPVSAANFTAALVAMTTIGAGGAKVSGVLGGPYAIEIMGANAGQICPPLLVDGASLDPVQEPAATILQQGDSTDYLARANAEWDVLTVSNYELRGLYVKLRIIDIRKGSFANAVDTTTGQTNVVDIKNNQLYTNLVTLEAATIAKINALIAGLNQAGRQTFGGVMTHTTPNGRPYGQLGFDSRTGRFT